VPRELSAGKASRVATLALLFAFIPVLGTGCDDDALPDAATTTTAPAAQTPPVWHLKWLGERDKTTPELWLASREAGADLDDSDPSVVAMHESLTLAAERFHDKPRMIANRAVQLEEMLAEAGIDESARDIIRTLTLAVESGARIEGFGSMCQYYYNLRKQGLGHDAALARLKEMSDAGMTERDGLLPMPAAKKG
jgi:hypothetical protein